MTTPLQSNTSGPIEPNRQFERSFWETYKKKLITILIAAIVTGLALGLGLMVAFKKLVPGLIQKELKARLVRIEKKAQVTVHTGKITPDGSNGVVIESFKIVPKGKTQSLVEIGHMTVKIDRARLLAGDKIISGLVVKDLDVFVVRDETGQTNVESILDNIKQSRKPKPETKTPDKKQASDPLRYFGGQIPSIEATNTNVHFISKDPDKPFPVERLEVPTGVLNPKKVAATIKVHSKKNPNWHFPNDIVVAGQIKAPLKKSALSIRFDQPLKTSGLPPYPFIEFGLSSLDVKPGGKLSVKGLTLNTTFRKEESEPLVKTKAIEVELANFPKSLRDINIQTLTVLEPKVQIRFNAHGASDVQDLMYAFKVKTSNHIQMTAKTVASKIASQQKKDAGINELPIVKVVQKPMLSLKDRANKALHKVLGNERIKQLIPAKLVIQNAELHIDDARDLPVARPTKVLKVADASLEFTHDEINGKFDARGGFTAKADKNKGRGSARFDLSLDYRNMGIQANMHAKAMDISWLAQLAGPRVANKLRGGTMEGTLKLTQKSKGAPIEFSGLFDLKHGYLVWPKLAEEAVDGWQIYYDFAGVLKPKGAIPAPRLLKTALDANVPKDDNARRSKKRLLIEPPTHGSLVFTKGNARFGKVEVSILPAFYGIDLKKPLPARFDLVLNMKKTPVQTALDTIPSALLGELVGTKLAGSVTLDLLLEIPMYDASEMIWRGEPKFRDVSIQKIASSMDVRKLARSFRHTIADDRVQFERKVSIGPMSLIPAQWLMDNAGLTLSDVDEHWRRGGWYEDVQDAHEDPNYWLGVKAMSKADGKPWGETSDGIVRQWRYPSKNKSRKMRSDPYGTYVFVPLHHISPWLIRAILTTEDNSFFRHDGFNRHALKQSIERNIAAGDYVRGASTISMQLVKNIFLTRKKVMARKIQEAILVYLMENVVQVPKARLMELYLNVIEFAPGVFGIHDAAVHYFGKRPDELTLAECAWLVTIVPGPKRYHYHWRRGEISDGYWNRIKRYIKIIRNRNRATEEEYQEAIAKKPSFYKPKESTAPALRPKSVPALPLEQLSPEDIQNLLPTTNF